jgi:hypothetical protein
MAVETEQLEYWADVFCLHAISKYMTLAAFLEHPEKYFREITGGDYRPLLPRQKGVVARIHRRFDDLDAAIDELEAQVEGLRRIENGHCYEQLKHHANGR